MKPHTLKNLLAAALLAASAGTAIAQPPEEDLAAQIRALQAQIEAQQRTLDAQQRALNALQAQLETRPPQEPPPPPRPPAADPVIEDPAIVGVREAPEGPPGPLEGWPHIGYDRGFFLRSADGDFGLKVGGWVQPRFEYTIRDDAENLSSFLIRRARVDVTGHVFNDRLTFRIMPELARTATLRDAFINYAFSPEVQLRGGQFTVPFQWHRFVGPRRQHFAERGIASEALGFPNGRDIGLMLHGQNEARTWQYALGVFDGAGRNVALSTSDGNMASGRITLALIGQVPRDETDYAHSARQNLSLGLGVQAANKNEVRAWDLGRSPAGNTRADWVSGTADLHYRWRGFSIVGDGYLRRVRPDDDAVDAYTGGGYMVSAGYAIMPDFLEAVARYNWLRLDLDDPDTRMEEWGLGLNFYHRGHDWKTRLNYLNQTGLGGKFGTVIVEHHLQF
jgi:hypothetical protein